MIKCCKARTSLYDIFRNIQVFLYPWVSKGIGSFQGNRESPFIIPVVILYQSLSLYRGSVVNTVPLQMNWLFPLFYDGLILNIRTGNKRLMWSLKIVQLCFSTGEHFGVCSLFYQMPIPLGKRTHPVSSNFNIYEVYSRRTQLNVPPSPITVIAGSLFILFFYCNAKWSIYNGHIQQAKGYTVSTI